MLAIAPAEKEELDDPEDPDHVGEVPPEPAPGPVVAAEPEGVREGPVAMVVSVFHSLNTPGRYVAVT